MGFTAATPALLLILLTSGPSADGPALDVAAFDRDRVLRAADAYLAEPPITIVASSSPRSAGGPHDYFSEGDYWWPNPDNPGGPYVQRDGHSNPENFNDHRRALMRLSVQVPALVAAWTLTGDTRYAVHAARHLRAWFVDERTRMHPHLEYAQAIQGRVTGRGTGIIDTIHLVEVARAVEVLGSDRGRTGVRPGSDPGATPRLPDGALTHVELTAIKDWFSSYLQWMTTHPYGIAERDAANNHGTCWVMQVAAFARLTGNGALQAFARDRFKTVLVPHQMAPDGSFPRELKRTKPYAYSLFNLEALAVSAELLSRPDDDLWTFQLPDGRGLQRAVAYMAPFISDKSRWPLPPDVMYDDEWPMRQNSLLFAARALDRPEYLALWETLPADSAVEETIRNYFVRQPVLWTRQAKPPASSTATPVVDGRGHELSSPSGAVRLRIFTDDEATLRYAVLFKGRLVIEPSALGLIVEDQHLGTQAVLGEIERFSTDERYPWRGVHAEAVNRSRGARIPVTHAQRVSYTIEARVFDDGAAVRYVVPGRGDERRVPDAGMSFTLPAGSDVWYHDFDRGHYEGLHVRRRIDDMRPGDWMAPPVTIRLPHGSGYTAITEAGLRRYAGMGLRTRGDRMLREVLGHAVPASYPFRLRYEPDIERLARPAAVTGTITTPWRVVIVGDDLHTLVVSDIVHNLTDPPDPGLFPDGIRTPWIRPGRAVWRYLDGGENTFEDMKAFSRLAGELGFEHHVVEGHWQQWPPERLRELVAFSRERGVGIWLWKHSRDLRDPEAIRTFFEMCRSAGVVGAKVDFLDHEAKEVIERYEMILREAARNHIMVNFHGSNKPAGEARTWPNELTREGVHGLEYRSTETWARHNTTLPFTRYLAGHGDYTPVIFGERRKETSWAHQIATAAIFTSPLLVYGAHPASILANPAVEVIRSIPSTWHETVVLPISSIGEIAAFARRTNGTWFLAIANGPDARTLQVPLSFLGHQDYLGTLVRDDPSDPAAVRLDRIDTINTRSVLEITLQPGGGFVGRFDPGRPKTP